KWGIKLVLIGGYAVRAYTKGYRFTKDIDLVATRRALGNLKALLRFLGYPPRDTEFGVVGSKRFNEGFIDLHISVGKIFDMSTGFTYPVTDDLFFNAKN
ncbi:MAG: nucleotidyl transferase AbiEii/AbiGii toxin family protein, partial [Candidatus Bathyarchaeia archaeon]|nr:nucleotidyl transferase AbiEii/AbiGii toxin family protein [Candidatus Bathyarchaeia archaeon]